ncbi:MAG TPA: phosphoribosylformylglycinamidine synthase subunit PurQ [Actinobacteria bacterium]|nr:phosphoribosylformylglycinamidine synthase subunit PurQ [Actinomycetota bacterium]
MRIAVALFPGTNCEHDVEYALGLLGADVEIVWHREGDLSDFAGVVLPGGFAHGDYLRTGAIARFSPIMDEVARLAKEGRPVLGICNGFQILCEADLLPGALIANRDLDFICKPVHVRVETTDSVLTRRAEVGMVLRIPLNSYEGNFVADEATLDALEARGRVVLRYCDPDGNVTDEANPNGSARNIAAIAGGVHGNVVGIMPHPERAVEEILGSADGRVLLESFLEAAEEAP